LHARQITEKLGVEEAHMLEYQQFNMFWDNKMNDYEQRAIELSEQLQLRQDQEIQDLQRTLIGKELKPKFSKDLLNLRRIEEGYAKQKK
jgi:hypothetical protein